MQESLGCGKAWNAREFTERYRGEVSNHLIPVCIEFLNTYKEHVKICFVCVSQNSDRIRNTIYLKFHRMLLNAIESH
jgi:hypothetical protein